MPKERYFEPENFDDEYCFKNRIFQDNHYVVFPDMNEEHFWFDDKYKLPRPWQTIVSQVAEYPMTHGAF